MPVLTIYGMPSEIALGPSATEVILECLMARLQDAAARELNLRSSEVSVFLPADLVQTGLGEELVCIVGGLFNKPEWTSEVREKLAVAVVLVLGDFARRYLSQCGKVEAIVNPFNQDTDGFAVWERPKTA